jgi:predicted MFS family arabinose efflux permease
VDSARLADVLRKKSFRYLFLGITFSRIGDSMTFIVISWLALRIGGPRAVGVVVFAGGIVSPVAAPVFGYLLDRLGVRGCLLADNLGRGVLMLGLASLVRLGHLGIEELIGFQLVSGCLSPATELGQNVAAPMLTEPGQLGAANRLLSSSWEVSAFIGPAFAGFAIAAIGSAQVLFIDAATFFTMAGIAPLMPGRQERPEQHQAEGSGRAGPQLLAGFSILWRLRPVAVLTVIGVADLFLGGMMEVFLPAFNKLTLHHGPVGYGLLVSIAGLACLCGTLFLTPVVDRLGAGPALVVVLAARGLAVLPLAFVVSWRVAVIVVAFAAVPDGSFFPMSQTVQQRLIPAGQRGRVQGARGALGVAGFPLGSALGGLLVAGAGAHATAAVMAAGYLLLAVATMLTPQLMQHTRQSPARDQRGVRNTKTAL